MARQRTTAAAASPRGPKAIPFHFIAFISCISSHENHFKNPQGEMEWKETRSAV